MLTGYYEQNYYSSILFCLLFQPFQGWKASSFESIVKGGYVSLFNSGAKEKDTP